MERFLRTDTSHTYLDTGASLVGWAAVLRDGLSTQGRSLRKRVCT